MDRAELLRAGTVERKVMPPAGVDRWIGLLLTFVSIVGGTIAATYSIFETKEVAKERSNRIETRLDRIESKLDRLIESR